MPPWGIGNRWIADSFMVSNQLSQVNPDAFKKPADPKGLLLYHQLLQWSILRWMSQAYGANWQAEMLHFDLPDSREGSYRSSWSGVGERTLISAQDVRDKLGANPFNSVNMPIAMSIALPPGTTLELDPATAPEGSEGTILLSNSLFSVTIITRASGSKDSVGTYARLAGLSEEEDARLFTAIYLVKIRAEFSRWRSGDPRMRGYRAWLTQLVEEFKGEFDEQAVWKRLTSEYLLRRHIEHLGPFK